MKNSTIIHWLQLGAVVGAILFLLIMLVSAQLRPGYSSVSAQISMLAVGPNGIYMRSAFILYGLLTLVSVFATFSMLRNRIGAVKRWTCAILLALSPFGVLWAGIFTVDHPMLHIIGAQLAFATPVITFVIVGLILHRVVGWELFGGYLIIGSPLTLILLIGFITSVPLSVMQSGGEGGTLGLWQRALAIEVMAWYAIMGWLAYRSILMHPKAHK